jgi:hypothetical protein
LNRNLNLTLGQGGPLAVTEVEETILETGLGRVQPRFRIVVENKADGNVFSNPDKNVEMMCSPLGVGDDLNRFDFKLQLSKDYSYDSKKPNDGEFACPTRVKLTDDKAEIICTLKNPIDAGTTFNTVFKIDLNYGYTNSESKEITIKKRIT